VESGRLMAADVWLWARWGSFWGLMVLPVTPGSLFYLSTERHFTHTGLWAQRLRYVEVCWCSVVLDGWPRTQLYSEWDRNKNEREVPFLRTGGTLAIEL